jgi:hypothetical protein
MRTPANVNQLRAQWVFHMQDANGLEVTPVVVNGLMFVTSANDAFMVDARTGRSSPMSYALVGKQYVASASGSDIFTLALP